MLVSGDSPCSKYGWFRSQSAASVSLENRIRNFCSSAVSENAPTVSINSVTPRASAYGSARKHPFVSGGKPGFGSIERADANVRNRKIVRKPHAGKQLLFFFGRAGGEVADGIQTGEANALVKQRCERSCLRWTC